MEPSRTTGFNPRRLVRSLKNQETELCKLVSHGHLDREGLSDIGKGGRMEGLGNALLTRGCLSGGLSVDCHQKSCAFGRL